MRTSLKKVVDDKSYTFEEAFDDGEDIFEKVCDDCADMFQEAFDDGENIFEKFFVMLKTSLEKFLMIVKKSTIIFWWKWRQLWKSFCFFVETGSIALVEWEWICIVP